MRHERWPESMRDFRVRARDYKVCLALSRGSQSLPGHAMTSQTCMASSVDVCIAFARVAIACACKVNTTSYTPE